MENVIFVKKNKAIMVSTVEQKNAPKKERLYSLEEYLMREERSVNKHEFHQGKIIKMPWGNYKHSEIAGNLSHALKLVVKPLPIKYRIFTSDLKIYIEAVDKALYPDALVVCEKPQFWNDREDLIVNPLMIVEVLSPSTRTYDRGEKFLLYEQIPTFKEYVLIEQHKPHVETWFREHPTTWNKITAADLKSQIRFRSLGVSVALSDIYENIDFQ